MRITKALGTRAVGDGRAHPIDLPEFLRRYQGLSPVIKRYLLSQAVFIARWMGLPGFCVVLRVR